MNESVNEWIDNESEWDCNNVASSMRAHAPIVNVWYIKVGSRTVRSELVKVKQWKTTQNTTIASFLKTESMILANSKSISCVGYIVWFDENGYEDCPWYNSWS